MGYLIILLGLDGLLGLLLFGVGRLLCWVLLGGGGGLGGGCYGGLDLEYCVFCHCYYED